MSLSGYTTCDTRLGRGEVEGNGGVCPVLAVGDVLEETIGFGL